MKQILLSLLACSAFCQTPWIVEPPCPSTTAHKFQFVADGGVRYKVFFASDPGGPYWCAAIIETDEWYIASWPLNGPSGFMRLQLSPIEPTAKMTVGKPLSDCLVDYRGHDFGWLMRLQPSELPKYSSSCLETQYFLGIIVSSGCQFLYVRSDDGATVAINGQEEVSHFGLGQNWTNMDASFAYVTRLNPGTNRVRVSYSNTRHSAFDCDDGISLFLVGQSVSGFTTYIRGTNVIRWYGDMATSIYGLNKVAHSVSWSSSPNLLITEDNANLQEVSVRPVRGSAAAGEEWVQAIWSDACDSTMQTSRMALTILMPRDEVSLGSAMGFMQWNGSSWFALSNTVQILDQFGNAWTNSCLVSSDSAITFPETVPAGTMLMGDLSEQPAPGGIFTEYLGISVPMSVESLDVHQNRAVRAHLPGIWGSTIEMAKIRYHVEGLQGNDVIVVQNIP